MADGSNAIADTTTGFFKSIGKAFKKVSDKVGKPLTIGGLILIPFLIVVPGAWALANPVAVATMAPIAAATIGFLNFYAPLFDPTKWIAGLSLWGNAIGSVVVGGATMIMEIAAPGSSLTLSALAPQFGTAAMGTSAIASTTMSAGADIAMNAGSSLLDAGTSITGDFMSNMAGSMADTFNDTGAMLSENFTHEAGGGLFSSVSNDLGFNGQDMAFG